MPSEHKMQFFTPELYLRYNSQDDASALAADTEWEAAIAGYRRHLATLREKMSSQVIELSKLCLHDGEILQRQEQQQPLDQLFFENWPGSPRHWPFWYGATTLAVRLEDKVVTIVYFLTDHMTEQPVSEGWPFSKEGEHWLYDEVDREGGNRGRFVHNILLSSGVVLSIPFATVLISRFALSPVRTEGGKQSA